MRRVNRRIAVEDGKDTVVNVEEDPLMEAAEEI